VAVDRLLLTLSVDLLDGRRDSALLVKSGGVDTGFVRRSIDGRVTGGPVEQNCHFFKGVAL
jgi:hypothetical protein